VLSRYVPFLVASAITRTTSSPVATHIGRRAKLCHRSASEQ
jgi:hypothetical protein